MPDWLLGPPGDLRVLSTPETNMNITEIRYGGTHVGLSGAKTVDTTGIRTQIDLTLEFVEESEYRWLQALHTRHIPGPHRLINPLRKNLLSIAAAKMDFTPAVLRPLEVFGGSWEWANDWPTGAGLGWRCLRWFNRPSVNALRFDTTRYFSCTPGQNITGSVYMKGVSGFNMTLVLDWYDKYGVFISSSTTSTAAVTTSWSRFELTRVPPAGAVLGRLAMYSSGITTEVRIAAPQVEYASSATAWDQGGKEILVYIDQMPAFSPRFPLMNCTLTLLEA